MDLSCGFSHGLRRACEEVCCNLTLYREQSLIEVSQFEYRLSVLVTRHLYILATLLMHCRLHSNLVHRQRTAKISECLIIGGPRCEQFTVATTRIGRFACISRFANH